MKTPPHIDWPRSFRDQLLLLVLLAAALLVPLGGSGSLERAEVYFMDGARTMLETGNWLVPQYRDKPFFDKPALAYWLIAGAFRLLGPSAPAARLVPALCALGTILVTVWLGALLGSRRVGLLAGLILTTTLPFVVFGHTAMADMPMTLMVSLAVAVGVFGWRHPERFWPVPTVGALLGLGFLTKGPVAVLLPGLALVPLAWSRRRDPTPLSFGRVALASILAMVIGLAWFVAIGLTLGREPLVYFFLRENLQRFAEETYDTGRGPLFYVWTYLVQGAPWSLFFAIAVGRRWQRWRAHEHASQDWLFTAVLLMVLPLSASRGKLDYYLLPLLPLASLAVAVSVAARWGRAEAWTARVAAGGASVALLGLLAAQCRAPAAWRAALFWNVVAAGIIICLTALLGSVVARPTRVRTIATLATATAAAFALLNFLWLPAFGRGQPNRAVVADVAREYRGQPRARLGICNDPARVHRDVIFSTRIDTVDMCEMWAITATRRPFMILIGERAWHSLWRIRWLRLAGEYDYLPMSALSLEALLAPPRPERLYLVANFRPMDEVGRQRWVEWRRQRRRALRAEYQAKLRRERADTARQDRTDSRRGADQAHPTP